MCGVLRCLWESQTGMSSRELHTTVSVTEMVTKCLRLDMTLGGDIGGKCCPGPQRLPYPKARLKGMRMKEVKSMIHPRSLIKIPQRR